MDTVTFLGPRIPEEVKKLFIQLGKLKQEVVQRVLALVVEYIKDDITDELFDSTAKELQLDKITLSVVFAGLFVLVKSAIRSRVKLDQIQKDLQELRAMPQFLTQDLVSLLKDTKQNFQTALVNKRLRYPTLEAVKWRVDVTISTQTMSRVLKPSVLMEIHTSDGKRRTFEMSVEKFHELRFNVAKMLKDAEEVEKLNILKIGQ